MLSIGDNLVLILIFLILILFILLTNFILIVQLILFLNIFTIKIKRIYVMDMFLDKIKEE